MLSFQYIEMLFLLALLPLMGLLFYYALVKKRKAAKAIGDPELVAMLTKGYNASAYLKKFLLLLTATGLIVAALANLRKAAGEQQVARNGVDVMIALDVSKSMLAQDIKPSRLERAKQLLGKLSDKLGTNRIGIVIFAGKAYLQMPLTSDHAAAKMYLSAASTESVPTQGTVIGDALKMCYASFNSKEKKYKTVVLISDGEDHDESAIQVAEQMAASGVIIHSIGIGSPQGVPLMDEASGQYKKDQEGNTVISKLNQEVLSEVSQKTGGQYQLYQNTEATIANLLNQINGMEQRAVTDDSLVNYKSFFHWFLAFAFLLLIIEFFMSEKKKIKIVKPNVGIVALFILLLSGNQVFAQDDNKLVKAGNDSYQKGDYGKATEAYDKAVQLNKNNAAAVFNQGNARYKSGKKEEAISAYEEAHEKLTSPTEKSNALYNKGVVLQNDQKLPECIEAYKAALKLDPANEDARQNLQKALQQQKKEQQKQDQQKNKKDQQNDKKKPQEDKPKPQPSKLSKQDAENKLKALMQKEKELQDKLHKVNAASANRPEKDW